MKLSPSIEALDYKTNSPCQTLGKKYTVLITIIAAEHPLIFSI